jgi:hypothetical protein
MLISPRMRRLVLTAALVLAASCARSSADPVAAPTSPHFTEPPVRYTEQETTERLDDWGVVLRPPPSDADPNVSGQEALVIASRDGNRLGSREVVMTLTLFTGFQVKTPTLVWLATFEGACTAPGGPPGIPPSRCGDESWVKVAVNASSGKFLYSFAEAQDILITPTK